LTNAVEYGIILVSRGENKDEGARKIYFVSLSTKIFEEISKNPLTNTAKCGII
jgi:hypothetical protein